MKLTLAAVQPSRSSPKSASADAIAADFLARANRYIPCAAEVFSTESALLAAVTRLAARTQPHLILLDSAGKSLTSNQIATYIGGLRDSGIQNVLLAIGPPDGWSPEARTRAGLLLSLGAITLPHELARAVLAEQIYRALTILAGHPYHSGH